MRRRELWDSNPRLAERIEMRIKDAQPEDGVSTAAAKTVDVFGGGNLVAASATARGAAQAAIGPGRAAAAGARARHRGVTSLATARRPG